MTGVNYCKEHGKIWFKSGRMKTYAHPIKDDNDETIGWCNMPEDAKTTELPPPTTPGDPLPEQQAEIEKVTKPPVAQPARTDPRQESIEAQVAIKEIGEDWRAGILEPDDPRVLARKVWITKALNLEITFSWQAELVELASQLDEDTRQKFIDRIREKLTKKEG